MRDKKESEELHELRRIANGIERIATTLETLTDAILKPPQKLLKSIRLVFGFTK